MSRIPAADWFRVCTLGDGVTWIDEPFVKEFYRCNIWHLPDATVTCWSIPAGGWSACARISRW